MLWFCAVTAEGCDFALWLLNAVTLCCNCWMLWLCAVTTKCCDFALWPLIAVTLQCNCRMLWLYTVIWLAVQALCRFAIHVTHGAVARITYVIPFFLNKHLQLCRKPQIAVTIKEATVSDICAGSFPPKHIRGWPCMTFVACPFRLVHKCVIFS
jgi:hypothetical protein